MKGASLATEEILYGVRGRLVWDESRVLIDGASVKEGLRATVLTHSLKLNFHRYIGQFRRLPPRLQKTPWRPLFVHKWRACEDDDCVHAKRNDKDVPQNSGRPKTRKASHIFVSLQ